MFFHELVCMLVICKINAPVAVVISLVETGDFLLLRASLEFDGMRMEPVSSTGMLKREDGVKTNLFHVVEISVDPNSKHVIAIANAVVSKASDFLLTRDWRRMLVRVEILLGFEMGQDDVFSILQRALIPGLDDPEVVLILLVMAGDFLLH